MPAKLTLRSVFDEISQRHASLVPPTIAVANQHVDAPVPDEIEKDMGNFVDDSVVDGDLLRAKQIGGITDNPVRAKNILADQGAAQLGNVTVLDNSHIALNGDGDPQQILVISDDDQLGEMMTVTLSPPVVAKAGAVGESTQVICVVEYGSGGIQNHAEIDWVAGLTFQVPGSYLRLSARLSQPVNPTSLQLQVGATVSRKPRSRNSKLIRSFHIGAVNHGAFGSVGVPAMATEVQYLYQPTSTVKNVVISVENQHGDTMYDRLISDNHDPLPLAGQQGGSSSGAARFTPGGDTVFFTNNEAGNNVADSWATFTIEL